MGINNILNRDKLHDIEREIEEKENFLNENKDEFNTHENRITELKKEKRKLISTWISTANSVSVGDKEEGITRQITNVAAGNEDTDAVNVAQLKNTGFNLKTSAVDFGERLDGDVDKDKTEFIKAGNTVEMIAGKNMSVKQENNGKITYATKDDVNFNSLSLGTSKQAPTLSADEDGSLKLGSKDNQAPVRISNVAPGIKDSDAVNVSQLRGITKDLEDKIDSVAAGSNAAASLPQAYLPGKSMFAASVGTYGSQGALAVGYSSISDNGKWLIKGQVNVNTKAKTGGGVGVGYLW
ncbi:YadA-like family protein [Neisseria sp. LACPHL-SPEC-2024-00856]|uniref:YadA-like family protein n=1 Tax=Neisseria sp. LACPHL-SPEC-2024-00856 TaxID=3391057 RepID=UPI003A4D3F0D